MIFNFINTHTKLRILLILNHLMVLSIFFLDNIHWIYWVIGLTAWIIIGKVGGEVGYHRYFAHRSFKTSKWKERTLLILGSLMMMGSSISWVGTHRTHHAKADTEEDPHSLHHQHWLKVWAIEWKPFLIKRSMIYDSLKDPWQIFIHRWYFELCLSVLLIIGMIDYMLLIFMISLPAIVQFHTGSLLVDVVCHKWGYRTFDTKDQSRNNILANILTLGSGLHNNHHGEPSNYYLAKEKWEFDIPGWIIKKFLISK